MFLQLFCQVFGGWVFEVGDFVEVVVIELVDQWFDGYFDFVVVDQVVFFGCDFIGYNDFDVKVVFVQMMIFVFFGKVG